jgi:hypothetical protein
MRGRILASHTHTHTYIYILGFCVGIIPPLKKKRERESMRNHFILYSFPSFIAFVDTKDKEYNSIQNLKAKKKKNSPKLQSCHFDYRTKYQ